jgi:putative addiction module CopG family antidote
MPRLDLGHTYDHYVQGLIDAGLYSTYTEVVKDALRQHMDALTESKRIAAIHAAVAEGEEDIKAGRFKRYTPAFMEVITQKVLANG